MVVVFGFKNLLYVAVDMVGGVGAGAIDAGGVAAGAAVCTVLVMAAGVDGTRFVGVTVAVFGALWELNVDVDGFLGLTVTRAWMNCRHYIFVSLVNMYRFDMHIFVFLVNMYRFVVHNLRVVSLVMMHRFVVHMDGF